jgi:hypothetical protein
MITRREKLRYIVDEIIDMYKLRDNFLARSFIPLITDSINNLSDEEINKIYVKIINILNSK